MAEAAVNIVIEKLIPFLIEEGTLLGGVKEQIEEIKGELELIKAYIRDADEKAERGGERGNSVKAWVKQVREAAYRIEDVMDEYMYHVGNRSHRCELVGVLCEVLKTLKPRHDIAHEIEDIKGSIVRLNQRRETFGFNPLHAEPSDGGTSSSASGSRPKSNLRLGAHFIDDSQLVGVDSTKQRLMDWLLSEDRRRTVIGVVGEGGLGKTTIVKNIYEKQKEKGSFDFYAWITVSHSFKDKKLLQAIQSFYKDDKRIKEETKDKETLIKEVKQYLQERRYMIVFDDVWEIEFWKDVEYALLDNQNGSRIMMTTRDRGVADFCHRFAPVHIHPLDPLPFQDALTLFHRKAFPFDSQGYPPELMGLSRDFVNKCNGVPLAIEAIAGLLSTKRKNAFEWKRVHDSLHSRMASDPHLRDYHQVLSESYSDLPYHLKLCLLYFGVFPEDYSVSCGRLARLWIAEGFVKEKVNEDQTHEEVAKEYLEELLGRNLVKASIVNVDDRVRECQVHDLMHNFILRKCEEISFCQVKESEEFEFYKWTRRLSIHVEAKPKSNSVIGKGRANYGRVRCCFLFNIERMLMTTTKLSSFKLLIVLDFEDAFLDYLPKTVGNLLHLKYLSLKNTSIGVLPKFIGKLQNLETLDLRFTFIDKLPAETNKLVKLRYLVTDGLQLKRGIGALGALQKLSRVDARDSDGVIMELKNLTKMRNLGITNLKGRQGKLLCKSIESLNHLYALYVAAIGDNELIDLQSLDNPPQYLQRLYLWGRLERVPEWIPRLQNLVRLRLRYSALKEDSLSFLQDLPELLELKLVAAYEGDEMHFRSGSFKKLKALILSGMRGLRTLRIDKGALPSHERMTLARCDELVQVPTHIDSLETLKHFDLKRMPSQFIESLRQKEGQSYDKIKAITSVTP